MFVSLLVEINCKYLDNACRYEILKGLIESPNILALI